MVDSIKLLSQLKAREEIRVIAYLNLVRGEIDDEPPSSYEEYLEVLDETTIKFFMDEIDEVVHPRFDKIKKK